MDLSESVVWIYKKVICNSFPLAFGLVSFVFSVVPEDTFLCYKILTCLSNDVNIIINRVIICIFILVVSPIIYGIYLYSRKTVNIKGSGYAIEIKYGDLFDMENCKKLITFDECFTTIVGDAPSEIKPESICGKYLSKYATSDEDINVLIDSVKLKPLTSKSAYNKKTRYESGRILPKDEYLLMAFAKLDKDGIGILSYEEFVDCLSILWKEINKYYACKDVCIPVLGSGVTRIGDILLTQQELLNIIILSYKLSSYKIKQPQKLRIICRKSDDFSLLNIEP